MSARSGIIRVVESGSHMAGMPPVTTKAVPSGDRRLGQHWMGGGGGETASVARRASQRPVKGKCSSGRYTLGGSAPRGRSPECGP